jgi:COMPASS component SWD1
MLMYLFPQKCPDVQWHPSQPLVIGAGLDSGTIYQWSTTITEGWSAFAPDFIELEENQWYEEREDEFDIVFNLCHCC